MEDRIVQEEVEWGLGTGEKGGGHMHVECLLTRL